MLILVIVFAFLLVGVRIFGLAPYTVLSGSMEPEYHVGSLIYVKKTSAGELNINDPITFKTKSGIVVTHRIIDIIVDENNPTSVSYRTKGDANDTPDGDPVHISNVIGKPVFHIPLLGYAAYYIKTPVGIAISVGVIVLLLFLAFLPDALIALCANGSAAEKAVKASKEHSEIERLRTEIAELESEREKRD